jgi:hypothetical protein
MTLKDGAASLGPTGPSYKKWVSAANHSKIAAKEAAMLDGSFTAYTGPIHDTSGKLRLADGKKLTGDQISTINWPVKGLIGNFSSN